MGRVLATVDVGSNSVTGLVAEIGPEGVTPLWQDAVVTRLGAGLDATGRLSDAALDRTLAALEAMAAKARGLGAEGLTGVATAAAREAENGEVLVARARALGVRLRIVTGDEEAQLSWTAAWREFGTPGGHLTMVDVGGRSTEIVQGRAEAFDLRVSLPLGSVRLTETLVEHDPPTAAEREAISSSADAALAEIPPAPEGTRLVAVAGTATTLAAVHLALPAYDADRVHGTELSAEVLDGLTGRLFALGLEARRRLPGMEPQRADVLPAGAVILSRTRARLGVPGLTVSDRGVRFGLLFRLAQGWLQ